jgi:hypothetical protein
MALKTGSAGALGVAVEVTPGVPVAPTVWIPFLPGDSLGQAIERMESGDIIAGRRYLATEQWDQGLITVGGDTQFELKNRGMGKLFAGMLGVPVTTGSGPYTHTYSTGDLPSLTLQKLVPANTGTLYPLTYAGMKVASWQLGFASGAFATLGITWSGMHEIGHRTVADGVTNSTTTVTSATAAFTENDIGKPISGTDMPAGATIVAVASATSITISANATGTGTAKALVIGVAAGTPSFLASQRSFAFQRGSISLGGTTVKVKTGTLSGANGLADDRAFIGQQWHDEALEGNELRSVTGSLELEFADRVQYNRYVAAAELAMVLVFRASNGDTTTITSNIRYDGETPKIATRGVIPQTIPIKAIGSSGDSSAITAVLVNSDSAY